MQHTVGTAWLGEHTLSVMAEEATRAYPCETGGVLLGYWATPYSEVVVVAAVGPGHGAIHEPMRFVPDADYQEAEIARWYRADPGRHAYLGDWHSHPHGGAHLSAKDRQALLQIARHKAARAPVPLMAVLTLDDAWGISVWRFQPAMITLFGFQGRTSLFRVQSFRQDHPGTDVRLAQ